MVPWVSAILLGALSSRVWANSQGPGVDWLGINGGYKANYNDSLGRLWYHSETPYSTYTWGGYVGSKPRDWYRANWIAGDDNETLGKHTCRNWPLEYDQDYDALLCLGSPLASALLFLCLGGMVRLAFWRGHSKS